MRTRFLLCVAAAIAPALLCRAEESRQHRITVEVPPVALDRRSSDQMPARVDVEFTRLLRRASPGARVDFDSLRVIAATTGRDVSFRWYDADIPEDFPEVAQYVTRTDGQLRRRNARMAGHFYNTSGRGERGFLAFQHTQNGSAAETYIVEFNLLPQGQPSLGNGPRGWLGDGQARCGPLGRTTTGSGHTRIALDDWNDDGLIDIVQGEEYGVLFVFPNVGTKTEPKFTHRQILLDADGVPLDVGMHAAPCVTDFDGDGVKDLLVGTHVDRLIWFKNTGSNRERRLVYKGYVTVNGQPLSLPATPIIGRSEDVFKHDYYPVCEAVDWNGDGRVDLLAGGYVTGRIYFFENTGANPDGTPRLAPAVALQADGKPLNVGDWCAAPTAADFNGDGLLDLISGNNPSSDEASRANIMLRYYEGGGSGSSLSLSEKPIPHEGTFPGPCLATPRAADMNGDGLLDLVVSGRMNIWVYFNRGTRQSPKFQAHNDPILLPWTGDPIQATQFIDYNHDGRPDLFHNYVVSLNAGKPAPFEFAPAINLLPRGVRIEHPSGIGDDWFWPYLADFDGDGDFDILFGDWFGHVWLHRNNGSHESPDYDIEGFRLKTTDGLEIKVGPIGKDPAKDFAALQGARTVLAVADLDGDQRSDMVVGDTYGLVRFYRNAGTAADPVFDPAVEVGNVKGRCSVDITDWDGDGRPDIIVGSAGGTVRVFRNVGGAGHAKFDDGTDPGLPPIKQPRVLMADLNGDGDEDLFIPGTQGSIWIERSFLKHGYAKGKVVKFE